MVEHLDADKAMTGIKLSGGLREVLREAQELGLIGRADLDVTSAHAAGFAAGVGQTPSRCLDLGSGGGLPGLVLAEIWPETEMWLLDGRASRADFLRRAARRLGREDQITVLAQRAESVGRTEGVRGSFDVVTARGFGPPPVTAECAAPLLRPGGRLIVSEPPMPSPERGGDGGVERWPDSGLQMLGMEQGLSWDEPFHYQTLRQREICPPRYPRRVGIPAKRPLF